MRRQLLWQADGLSELGCYLVSKLVDGAVVDLLIDAFGLEAVNFLHSLVHIHSRDVGSLIEHAIKGKLINLSLTFLPTWRFGLRVLKGGSRRSYLRLLLLSGFVCFHLL